MAIANALQLEAARRHASAFPLQLRRHAKFNAAEPIHCRIIAFLLLIHYITPWPWPSIFDLEHLQRIVCDVMKLNLNAIEQSAAELLFAISVFDLMTLNMSKVLRPALG